MNDDKQFETIAKLRAYAQRIVDHHPMERRPSYVKELVQIISRMHNLKDELEVS